MSLGPTAPEEIIEFLLSSAAEPYPYARVIALLTLCAWMRWPDDDDVVLDAQTTAAATGLLHGRRLGKTAAIPLTLERACDSIVNRQIYGQYTDAFDEQSITDMVAFFMHCPEEQRPSLGKAYHFIAKEGFISSDFDKRERKQMTRARSSLKAAWKSQAKSGPLLWATLVVEDDSEVYWFAPDDGECFEAANAFAHSKERLLNLFGVALFCQQKLTRLLRATGAAKISFLRFPRSVKPVAPDIETFDEQQLEILNKYVAPQ